ncbi:protein kinase family protein [Actinomycetota bacterium Odt1-20B]
MSAFGFLGARGAAHRTVGTHLSLLSDRRLAERVAAAVPLGAGIGGRAGELDVDGVRVFVKRVPLTDLELEPAHVRSTANLFGLPMCYQYGVGSAGFGAWRELAAHVMTTNWVLGDAYAGFPLLHHWRVLPDAPPEGFVDEFGGVEGAVAHWDGSRAVRRRLEAIGSASSSLVLFLEHVPHTLAESLRRHRGGYAWAEGELGRGTAFMSANGFVHFDAHFANVLTDGHRICFADLGLALSSRFELGAGEREFLDRHLLYDRSHTVSHLIRHHLLDGVLGDRDPEVFLREWIAGRRPDGLTAEAAGILDRHAHHTLVLHGFHRSLLTRSKQTPFPATEIERALNTTVATAG